ncbi:hypothetical protein RHABOEDO_000329 [Candidatus Rhabdochlamydia oedothoracis]|uniref:Integrase catalytic domain-containing protein n=1 Tax=Candidatus Rhabdochlamydia oedothoracis TaxID=2720720 RepID=A0ABX8UZ26_9BACT|nr:hypothetical protein RHOW815_001456 [Candidatus Rhabdochlamydia sp. W815]QYF48212.1 hypothetical protein RHABOEDO_000329 [Candidatus Rhabdochlamydia oedothoracis]
MYHSLEELQMDVDKWLKEYNEERVHSVKYCYGKTPWQTFQDAKHLAQMKMLDTLYQVDTRPLSKPINIAPDYKCPQLD